LAVTVVAALIERDGRVLICQRSRAGSFPLSWEFPGGKVEPGETLPAALARELQEELGVECSVGVEQYRTKHSYREFADALELVFFSADFAEPLPDLVLTPSEAFEQVIWERVEALSNYDFLPADGELVARLVSRAIAAAARPPKNLSDAS
jgi:8-oxo-dGTP diphosphatase